MEQIYIARWQQLLADLEKSWVIFSHGTCVILTEPEGEIPAQAIALLGKWGPVHPGGELGDFGVISLTDVPGWVITCAHPDIMTYLPPEEIETDNPTELMIGLSGRGKRDQDGHDKAIIFVKPS